VFGSDNLVGGVLAEHCENIGGVRLARCRISACGSFDGAKLAIDGFVCQGGIANSVLLVAKAQRDTRCLKERFEGRIW
jgi:hypothetical protein